MKKISSLALALFLSTIAVLAQDTTGRIVGTVSAPDGAVPGATVLITDNQTGKQQTITTSDDGAFTVPQLEFGTYTVRITAQGFKTFTATDVKIDAGREYPLNAQLEIGEITQEVTVTAGAETINATNAELSTTVSTQQIKELPLNGRNPLSLLSLQAGANPTTNSINGQRSASTTFTRDGLNVQDNFIRTGAFVQDRPTVDDVSEITLVTQNAGVEQGGGSSVVQLVTPRGGKDFHGSLYAFNRNSKFAANNFFNNSRNIPRPFLNRNEFGGTISGPLALPGFNEGGPVLLRNKAFFFFNYEGFRLAQQVAASGTTLLPAARNGNFTYVGTDNVTRTVNVLTGEGFNLTTPANQAEFARVGGRLNIDPIIQSRLLNNLPNSGNGLTTGTNYLQVVNFQRSNGAERNAFSTRVDIDFNDRNTFNAVYKRNNELNDRPEQAAGFSTTPFVTQGGPTNFVAAAYRSSITNNFFNEIRGGFQYSEPFFYESNIPSDFLIGGLPFTNPEGSFRNQGRNTLYRNIQDNAVYTTGNHSFRFGGQVDFYKFEVIGGESTPIYNISSTNNPNTPGLIANLLPNINATDLARANTLRYTLGGIVGSGSLTANLISPEQGYGFQAPRDIFNFEIYSAYFSDQWRLRPNLTLNLGLRYEFYTPLNTPNPKYLEPVIADPDNIAASVLAPGATLNYVGGNAGKPGDFFRPDKDNFAPSVSFAYSPKFENGLFAGLLGGDFVLRGGFRINYINDEYVKAASTLVGANAGVGSINTLARRADNSANLRSTFSPSVNPQFEALPGFSSIPTLTAPPRLFSTNNAAANFLGSVFGVDPNYQVQRNYEYNIGIQREIGFKTVFEVRYVGGYSNEAARTTDLNQIDIQNNGFLADFQRAQNNCRLQGQTLLTGPNDTRNPLFLCTSAAYNQNIPGSQQLTVFNNLAGQGNLTNTTNLAFIQQGRVGSLAQNYINLRQQGAVRLQPTSEAFIVEILTNGGQYRYNALQAEIRRRFSDGVGFQVNYTFQKTLTDILSDVNADQNRQGRFLDNNNPRLNYGRADYDRTHTVNANVVYELPFGKGKRFLNQGGLVDLIFGGFQFGSIINLSSGPPLSIIDPRSTFGITGNSGRQSARTSLTRDEVKNLTGVFNTPNGIFYVDPKVLFATATAPGQPTLRGIDLNQPLPAGYTLQSVRAASPIDQAPFPGQVFFFNNAGETGNLPINFMNGLPFINWNANLNKNFRIGETKRLQLRVDAFNLLNNQVPFFGADLDINSDNFGRVTSTYNGARVLQFGARFDF